MARLRIQGLQQIKTAAIAMVDYHFNQRAGFGAQKDLEHQVKREVAFRVAAGAEPPAAFVAEAELYGQSPVELANTILSKDDDVLERGLARRKIIMEIRAAGSSQAIEAILNQHEIERPFEPPPTTVV